MTDPSSLKRAKIIDALRHGTVPQKGLELYAVGMERFEKAIDAELALASSSGGGFKAVRGEYGAGKTFFARWLEHRALAAGFATSLVQISNDTPLYKMEAIYRRAVENLQTKEWEHGAFRSLVGRWFFALEEESIAEGTDASDPEALTEAVGAKLETRLAAVSSVQPQFAAALRTLHAATLREDHATADGLLGWLMAQPNVGAEAKRSAGLKGEVDHHGASGFVRGLLELLRQTGRKGLVLVLDECETIQRTRRDQKEKSLNALRQLIDDVSGGVYRGLYVVITGTTAFFEGPDGIKRLPPLAERLHTDFSGEAQFDNPRAPQVRLRPFDIEKLVDAGKRVRALYPAEAPERIAAKIDDALLRELALGVAGSLGKQVGVAPRIYLRKLVTELLDKVDQFPDYDPRQHFKLVVDVNEMSAEERSAAGVARSVDDIALDVDKSDDGPA